MLVRFFEWDYLRDVECKIEEEIKPKDLVVVDHDWGVFLAKVARLENYSDFEGRGCFGDDQIGGKIIRKARESDIETVENQEEKEKEMLEKVKNKIRFLDVPMKVVDLRMSYDGGCAMVAFVADGRVDFRSLVREFSAQFGKSIRFQQIGSRDEARRCGGFGLCGKEICCKKFSGSLKSITTDMARCQLIAHRGSDRLSGLCGRLMCCLAYESTQYKEMLKEFPYKGESVLLEGRKGVISDIYVLAEKVKIEFEDRTFTIVSKDKISKDKKTKR